MTVLRTVFARAALATVLGCALAVPAWSVFDEIEVSPRARALGGSWSSLTADAYAPFHNPAGLAWWTGIGGSGSSVRPFGYDFSSQQTVAATVALPGGAGGAAIGVRRFGVDYLGKDLSHETTIALAHGFRLMADAQSELAVGWSLSFYSLGFAPSVTGIDPGEARSVGLGLGASALLRDRTRIGFQALNVNGPNIGDRDKQDLGRCLTAGIAYSPYPGVETLLEICNPAGETTEYRGGAEFQVASFAWLRAGLHTEPNTFTAGVGMAVGPVRLDYGMSTGGGVLGETHQFGIGYRAQARP
jgi:hypothetical protein